MGFLSFFVVVGILGKGDGLTGVRVKEECISLQDSEMVAVSIDGES